MSKKIISLLLAVMLTVSMLAVAVVSVSADIDDQGRYVPGENVEETYRYYFYMPSKWYNDKASTAGIYWYGGTDISPSWPGYGAHASDVENVYYCDVPSDVGIVIWNNFFDGGSDDTSPDYPKAVQTVDMGSEYYDEGDSDLYDAFPEYMPNESFDGMIFVVDDTRTSINDYSGKETYSGEWYYYFGDGTYSVVNDKEEAEARGLLFTSEFNSIDDTIALASADPTDPEDTEPEDTEPEETEPEDTEPVAAPLTVDVVSNFFPEASAEYDEATKELTVTFELQTTKNMLNTEWTVYYDPEVLFVSSEKNKRTTICPATAMAGPVFNILEDHINFNISNMALFDFTSEKTVFAQIVFDVVADTSEPVNTTIDMDVAELTLSEYPEGEDLSDPSLDVAVIRNGEVNEDVVAEVVVDINTALTPSTFVVDPTDPEATDPEATDPEATEPEATDPEATEPESTNADATSATGAQVNGTSSNDTATPSNGAVQTGDASLAIVILSLLVAATGVMFVLRKREMF